jgi:hypothetical protein
MRLLALGLAALLATTMGCEDEPEASPWLNDNAGTAGASGTGSMPCKQYCDFIVANGTNCADYDQGGQCVANCITYANGPCPQHWLTYRKCVSGTALECVPSDNGKTALSTQGCAEPFTTFVDCLAEHDAGLCP